MGKKERETKGAVLLLGKREGKDPTRTKKYRDKDGKGNPVGSLGHTVQ